MFPEYHKIQSIYLRDPATKNRHFLDGQWSRPEFGYLANNLWQFTEKVDGTNVRVKWGIEGILSFGGKTENASLYAGLYERLNELFSAEDMAEVFGGRGAVAVCLYGEGYGSRIQSGKGYLVGEADFVLFDALVTTEHGQTWLTRPAVEDVALALGLRVVPVIGQATLYQAIDLVREGFASTWNSQLIAEGIVARPAVDLFDRRGERVITKIKYRDFAR